MASSVAPHARTMNTAVLKTYVVERIDIMLVHCMAMTHGQSSGVTTLCGEASEREDPTLLSPAMTRARLEGDWTLIAPVPCFRRRRRQRMRRRH